jgi:hypothetical protein
MSEDQLLSAVLELAALRGWLRYHVRNSRAGIVQGDVGFPDLVLCRGQQLLFVELKSGKWQPGPAQRRWLDALAETRKAEVWVWWPHNWTDGAIERALA